MTFLALAAVIILAYLGWFYLKFARQNSNDPPGPLPFPLIGNLIQIGSAHHLTYLALHKLALKYGPVLTLWLGHKKITVVSGHQELKAIMGDPHFDDRGPETQYTIMQEVFFGQKKTLGVLFASGAVWRENRRFALRTLRDFGFGKHTTETLVLDECSSMVHHIKKMKPQSNGEVVIDEVEHLFTMMALNVIWNMAAGIRYGFEQKEMLQLMMFVNYFNELGSDLLAGPLAAFQGLRHLPSFKRKIASSAHNMEVLRQFLLETVEHHRQSLDVNDPRDYIDAFLVQIEKEREQEQEQGVSGEESVFHVDHLIIVLMDLFLAGTETTSKTMTWACLFMIANPQVQDRVQEELDSVVGSSSLVSLAHRSQLSYTEATLQEVWRLGPVGPIAATRFCKEDTHVGGYRLKAGTVVLPLLYSLTVDSRTWRDPKEFRPERHLRPDDQIPKTKEQFLTFGTGRRKCLGESVAKIENFLFFANLLKYFKLSPPEGEPIPSAEDIADGLTIGPNPFKIKFELRTQNSGL